MKFRFLLLLSLAMQLQVANAQNSSAISYWNFDTTSGSKVTDESGNKNDATLGASVIREAGKIGNGATFNGSDGSVSITLPASSTYSISAWVFSSSPGSSIFPRIIETPDWRLFFARSSLSPNLNNVGFSALQTETPGDWRTISNSILDGVWIHVVLTYDSSSLSNIPKIYINNNLQTISSVTAPSGNPITRSGPSLIGNSRLGDRPWHGKIDEVQVFEGLLSAEQIAELYNAGCNIDNDNDGSPDCTLYCPDGVCPASTANDNHIPKTPKISVKGNSATISMESATAAKAKYTLSVKYNKLLSRKNLARNPSTLKKLQPDKYGIRYRITSSSGVSAWGKSAKFSIAKSSRKPSAQATKKPAGKPAAPGKKPTPYPKLDEPPAPKATPKTPSKPGNDIETLDPIETIAPGPNPQPQKTPAPVAATQPPAASPAPTKVPASPVPTKPVATTAPTKPPATSAPTSPPVSAACSGGDLNAGRSRWTSQCIVCHVKEYPKISCQKLTDSFKIPQMQMLSHTPQELADLYAYLNR